MARGGRKPMDVLIADLELLNEYLVELAGRFRSEGSETDADAAEGLASPPLEALEALEALGSR